MKLWRWLVILALLVAAGIALRLTVLAPKPVKVRLAKVERGVVEETVSNSRAGTVKVRRRAGYRRRSAAWWWRCPTARGTTSRPASCSALDDACNRPSELYRRGVVTSSAQAERPAGGRSPPRS
jgi:hypothetical protein